MSTKIYKAAPKTVTRKARVTCETNVHAKGREIWTIYSDGQSKKVVTTVSSTATMDTATATFANALKNLAKK